MKLIAKVLENTATTFEKYDSAYQTQMPTSDIWKLTTRMEKFPAKNQSSETSVLFAPNSVDPLMVLIESMGRKM